MVTSEEQPESTRRGMWSRIPADGTGAAQYVSYPTPAAIPANVTVTSVHFYDAAGPSKEFEQDVAVVFDEARTTLLEKHQDYGPKNIADAPGGPINGLRVRCYDKLARINHLYETGAEPTNEAVRDSWLDLLNYSAIALLVLNGQWPE